MEKFRSTLILAAHGLGLLIIALSCFNGSLYIFKDNFLFSVIFTLLILAILLLLVYWISGAKERKDNKGFTRIEGVGLFFYVLAAIVSFIFMAHFINVNLILKDDIVKTSLSKLNELEGMVDAYEKKVDEVAEEMEAGTENLIRDYKTSNRYPMLRDSMLQYGIRVKEPQLVESEVNAAQIANVDAAKRGIPDLRHDNDDFYAKKERVLIDWSASELQQTLEDIDERLSGNYSRLREQFVSQSTPPNHKWNAHTFEYTLPATNTVQLNEPFTLMEAPGYNLGLPLIASLFVHIFILSPYLLMGRYGIQRIYPSAKKHDSSEGSIKM